MSKEIILVLTDHDKRVLSTVGRNAYGKELIDIIRKVKNQLCSLDSIDREKDYNDQVEGRLLFKGFADELIEHLSRELRVRDRKPIDPDEYT